MRLPRIDPEWQDCGGRERSQRRRRLAKDTGWRTYVKQSLESLKRKRQNLCQGHQDGIVGKTHRKAAPRRKCLHQNRVQELYESERSEDRKRCGGMHETHIVDNIPGLLKVQREDD